MSELRPDPRSRPPDPAGTQPKVDPESLRAAGRPALSPGSSPGSAAASASSASAETTAGGALAVALPGSRTSRTPAAPVAPGGADPHAPRFQFLFGALGALSVTAVALAIALLRAPAPAAEAPWSAWRPAQSEVDPAQQIANFVAPQYRLDDGRQIVQVTGGPPVLKGQPLTVGIYRSGQTPVALEGNNVLYQLCGGGVDCSIKEGKVSFARGLLIGREALALALYTFRYVAGVDHVIVMIPPPPPGSAKTASASTSGAGASTSGAVAGTGATSATATSSHVVSHAFLFAQRDLAPALERPLSATLSTVTPRISQMTKWPDAAVVKALIGPHVQDFTISETQQTGPVMLLEPPGVGG